MKSFNKFLSLVLALAMVVSLVAVPSAYAARFPIGNTSSYEVAVSFVEADGTTEVSEVQAGSEVYLRLDLKNISTLNSGAVTVALEGGIYSEFSNKLEHEIFSMDTDMTETNLGEKACDYGLSTDVSNLTSKNERVNYYAFSAPTNMYLALYKITVDEDATEVTATIEQNLMFGDADGTTGNKPVKSDDMIVTNDSVTVAGGDPIIPDPDITYTYEAFWKNSDEAHKVFPENTTDDEIKAEVEVEERKYADGELDSKRMLDGGFTVTLDNGNVTVTIDAKPEETVDGGLSYEIEEHVAVISCRYEAKWKAENAFDFGTVDAVILSNVEVKKYTTIDGEEDEGVVITDGVNAIVEDGVVTITIEGQEITLTYSIIDKVEYKNAKIIADDEYEYSYDKDDFVDLVEVTVEKWVNGKLDESITLKWGDDYTLNVIFDENYNDGRIDVTLKGEYEGLTADPISFVRINPTIIYSDVSAGLSQTEFPEGVTEGEIEAAVSAKAMRKEGNLSAEAVTLNKGTDYTVTVDLEAKTVTVTYSEEIGCGEETLDFDITLAVITYENAKATLSDSVFGKVPEAADIIARLTVVADMLKNDEEAGSVTITSDNYDVEIGENVATITFKNAFENLEAVEVEFTVEEVDYSDPLITVDGIISADGKDDEEIIEEAWTLITAKRDVLTNGIVTDSEELDAAALKELGVEAEIVDDKVVFTYKGTVLAGISVSKGTLQYGSSDPRTSATEFIRFVGVTLKNIFENILIKTDTFQIITLNADEWVKLSDAIEAGYATVTVDGVTYDRTNLNEAELVLVEEDIVSLEVVYDDVESAIEVSILDVPTDYANEEGEAPVVSITTDATQAQIGTDVTATVYVSDLTGNIETGSVSLLFSNAEVYADDIVAGNGFRILSKTVDANEIKVVFTINDAAYDAGAEIFTVTFDTTNSDVNAKLGLAIREYALTRIVDIGGHNEFKPVNATIGDNVEVEITAGDVYGFEYEVSYSSQKTSFYTDAEAVADVKVLAYPTINGERVEGEQATDVTSECVVNANNGVITVDKDGIRVNTLTYSIYETAFDQLVAIETIGSVDDAKFTDNVTVKLDGADYDGAVIALDGRSIKVSVAGIKAEGTYEIAVAVPGYTKATLNVAVTKKANNDGYDATVITGSKIYAGDIISDNRITAADFSDIAGKYGQAKETKYDLYTGNDSDTIDNLDITTMAHYFIVLDGGLVSADGTTIEPYEGE